MRTPEQYTPSIHQDIPDTSPGGPPPSPEQRIKLFPDTNAFITGATRGFGKSEADALLPEVNAVRSCYIHDAKLDKGSVDYRVVEPYVQEARANGYDLDYERADITTLEGRQAIFDMWDRDFGGNINMLILNASGSTREINVIAANALVDGMLERRHRFLAQQQASGKSPEEIEEATIVLIQSVPGRFAPQLRGNPNESEPYIDIAAVKHEGQLSLDTRIEEFTNARIKYRVMAPPEAPDTLNMKMFSMADKDIHAKMGRIAYMLGLPHTIKTQEVGPNFVKLLQKNVPQGYVDFMSDTKDARTEGLNRFYGESAIYVDTFERIDASHGIGRMIVNHEQTDPFQTNNPTFNGKLQEVDQHHIIEEFQTDEKHARDHFKDGMLKVVPGHNSIRFAVEALDVMYEELKSELSLMQLTGFDSAQFLKPILPGEKITVEFVLDHDATLDHPRGNAIVRKADGTVATFIEGLQCQQTPEEFVFGLEQGILPNQLIESWAQTMGLTGAEAEDVPMIESIGKTEFYQEVFEGEAVANVTEITDRPPQGFMGNVYCWSGEDVVGVSRDIKVRTITHRQAQRIFGRK